MFGIVERTMNVSANCLSAAEKRSLSYLRTGSILTLAIWILKSGACISLMRAMFWVVKIFCCSVSDMALWIAPVSSSACFSYCENWRGMYKIRSRRFNSNVLVNNRSSVVSGFFLDEDFVFCVSGVRVLLASLSLYVAAGVPLSERVDFIFESPFSSLASSVLASFFGVSVCVGLHAKWYLLAETLVNVNFFEFSLPEEGCRLPKGCSTSFFFTFLSFITVWVVNQLHDFYAAYSALLLGCSRWVIGLRF